MILRFFVRYFFINKIDIDMQISFNIKYIMEFFIFILSKYENILANVIWNFYFF